MEPRYFLTLRCCGAVYEASADYAGEIKQSGAIDLARLKKASGGFGGNYDDFYKTCPQCGKAFDKSFAYCPYCGKKF